MFVAAVVGAAMFVVVVVGQPCWILGRPVEGSGVLSASHVGSWKNL